tara:strand:- start:1271 stop:2596 length:1326 start_codon:yes stop_codon:yes gene_type:complete
MNITKQNVDPLNVIITVTISKADYSEKVNQILEDHRKKSNTSGFRKGSVPMSVIQKQFGKSVLTDEVNKIVQRSFSDYLAQQKLDILGNPIPKVVENFSWDAEEFNFEFELGLAPEFDIDLSAKTKVILYTILADNIMVNGQVERIQKQYGKLMSKEIMEQTFDVSGTFFNQEKGIENRTTFSLNIFNDKKTAALFIGKKVGDVIVLNTKGLFDDDHKLMDHLKIEHDDVHGLDIDVNFTIEEINDTELATLNQELFDKLFGEGKIASVDELKAKIKEDAEEQFKQQADQKFLNDVTESLIETTKFDLPSVFLKKWIQSAGKNPMSAEQAEQEYERSEKGLRYQLIEGKVIIENNLQTNFEDLKTFTSTVIKKQMAQFGQINPTDQEVQGVVARVLSNQEEIKRLTEQVMSEKLLNLYKEKVPVKTKEVSYQDFVKEMYGE